MREHYDVDRNTWRSGDLLYISRVAGGIPASWVNPAWNYFRKVMWPRAMTVVTWHAGHESSCRCRQSRDGTCSWCSANPKPSGAAET